MEKNYVSEITWLIVAGVFLLFVTTNANTSLGTTYMLFLALSAILFFTNLYFFNKKLDVTLTKGKGGFLEHFIFGIIGWALLLAISFVIMNFVDPSKANVAAIMSSLNAANPVFSDSRFLNYLVVALAIPFIETLLWARGLEFITDRFKLRVNKKNLTDIKMILIIGVLSLVFAIFHATAKQLAGQPLFIVFIMMAISLSMVVWKNGDVRAAIYFHVIANGVAASSMILNGGLI